MAQNTTGRGEGASQRWSRSSDVSRVGPHSGGPVSLEKGTGGHRDTGGRGRGEDTQGKLLLGGSPCQHKDGICPLKIHLRKPCQHFRCGRIWKRGFQEVTVLVSESCATLCNPMDPLSVGLSSQEYWSGLPFPSPGDLPDSGVKPTSPALAGRFFTV